MTIVLARVASCKEIVVCTPCGKDSAINPALLFAARSAGATEVYRVGGAQAIAAMALGTETIGTDAGQAHHFVPPFPAHFYMHGKGRYGLQCLTNLDQLPPTGAVIVAAPLKIRQGSGSPLRVLALVGAPARAKRSK